MRGALTCTVGMVLVGTSIAMSPALVDYPGNPFGRPVAARTTTPLELGAVGSEAVLLFEIDRRQDLRGFDRAADSGGVLLERRDDDAGECLPR